VLAMAVDEHGHETCTCRCRHMRSADARLETLGRGFVAAILGGQRSCRRNDPAALDRALTVDGKSHHRTAEQGFAGLELGSVGLLARTEPALEREPRHLVLAAR